jgi:nucleoside-diphosphate-sugar epimerase
MKVFVAGATGAVGKRLVPLLVANGHEVVGTTRSAERAGALRKMGAEPVVVDVLDRDAVIAAVTEARPDAIVHQATALTGLGSNLRRLDRVFAPTNRLRTEGTDNLLAAARAAGVRRFVAQSFAGWPYAREGGPVKSEEDPLDANPPKPVSATLAAIRHLESAVTGADGIEGLALRYGGFYGPGTSLAEAGQHVELIRKRRFPIVGSGAGVWSFLHIDDAATATLAAVERGAPGVYNVVDDEPAPVSVFLPELAKAIGAKPPRHVPLWVGRIAAGEVGVIMMTEIRGASNAKAKRELGWRPRWASWREGFRSGLVDSPAGRVRPTPGGSRSSGAAA